MGEGVTSVSVVSVSIRDKRNRGLTRVSIIEGDHVIPLYTAGEFLIS